MSNLVVSLYNYDNDYVSMFSEEENEKGEGEESSADDKYYFLSHKPDPKLLSVSNRHYLLGDILFPNLYSNKPETPPPNFC
jgi:hypothetical protein